MEYHSTWQILVYATEAVPFLRVLVLHVHLSSTVLLEASSNNITLGIV